MADPTTTAQEPGDVGFSRVDAQPDPDVLVAGLEAIARWPAVQKLRRWEREQLALKPGDVVLDVGCGVADVALTLAADVAPGGEVVGIDASEAMLAAARRRAGASVRPGQLPVALRIGDALALDEPDGRFNAVRGERVLQWLPRPGDAMAEMVRVLAPGGRLSLIDTDWRTFALDLPGCPEAAELTSALLRLWGDGARAGGRLLNWCRGAGLTDLRCTGAVHVFTEWDPEREPGSDGLFPVRRLVPELVERQFLDPAVAERALAAMIDAGHTGTFFASLSMFAVSARKP